jgi:ubiquinone/menaquinone biosynthesis C-methylase UbiE
MTQVLDKKTIGISVTGEDGILLLCPNCQAGLGFLSFSNSVDVHSYDCSQCYHTIRRKDGIWRALTPDRLEFFSRFIEEYQNIRSAEGRGSMRSEFYLSLPYKDLSGKNAWQWKIRARTYDYLRKKLLPGQTRGRNNPPKVLDLGAGNGWMSHRLMLEGYFSVAVDLLVNDEDGLGAATHFKKQDGSLFPRFQAEMSRLPFLDEQFDVVIFNASFHYAENYHAVLKEALRCVKRGGRVIVADTPWYSTDESGKQMVAERQAAFKQRYGTASNSVPSLEYLTDQRLRDLEQALNIRWEIATPNYGLQWKARPLLAKLRSKREPSRFRIYSTRKTS